MADSEVIVIFTENILLSQQNKAVYGRQDEK